MEGPMQIGPSVHALRHSWTLQPDQQFSTSFHSSRTPDQLWLPLSFPMPPAARPTSLPASLFQFPSPDSSSSDFNYSSGVQPQIRGPGARLERISEFHDESSEYDTDSSSNDGRESLFSESSEGTLSMPVGPVPSADSLEALTMLEVDHKGGGNRGPLADAMWTASLKQAVRVLYHPLVLAIATESLSQLAFQAVIADQVFIVHQLTAMLGANEELKEEVEALRQLQSKLQAMIKLQAEPSQGAKTIGAIFSQGMSSPSAFAQSLASALACLKIRAWVSANLAKAQAGEKAGGIFQDYVAAFAAKNFQDVVTGLETHFNFYTSSIALPNTASLQTAFSAELDLELHLLTATQILYTAAPQAVPAPFLPNPTPGPVPVVFATDFDVTCTLEDSSEMLMHLAAAAAGEGAEQQCREGGGSTEECALAWEEAALGVRSKWDQVLERYSKNLQTVISDILTPPGGESASQLEPPAMEVSIPESSSLGFTAPIDVRVRNAPQVMSIELPSPSGLSEPSESPRYQSLAQAASQPNLASLARTPISRSPSEPAELGQKLRAPSRAFDIESGAAIPSILSKNRPFDPEGLRLALERLGALEGETNTEVEAAGVLRGMTADKVFAAAAHEVKVRPHVGSLLTRVQCETGQPIHALSANWSADLIKGALATSIATAGGQPEALLVHSNNLAFDVQGISTGHMRRAVVSAPDKLRVIEGLMAGTYPSDPAFQSQDGLHYVSKRIGEGRPFTIYLGDGVTDLLALLSADLGIVVGHSFSLRKICAAFGVKLQPLVKASVEMTRNGVGAGQRWSGSWSGVLYETSGWEEVEACIFGNIAN